MILVDTMRKILFAASLFIALPLSAQSPHWFATWSPSYLAAPAPIPDSVDRIPTYVNRTIRQIVHTTIGGQSVRIRLTNEYGTRPLVIGSAHIALRDSGSAIQPATDHALTFNGRATVTLRPGAFVTSDEVKLQIPQLSDIAVSLWVRDTIRAATRHPGAHQTSYVSSDGDFTSAATLTPTTTFVQWVWLAGVDVTNPAATGVIVTFGNSITDGLGATLNANSRWPDVLARRMLASSEPVKAVVNAGITGNRVLAPGIGPSALSRFDRDVLSQPGVTQVIVLEGINDLLHGTATPDSRDSVTPDDIIFGYQQLIARAHERGVLIYGATLTPIGGLDLPITGGADVKRQAVNKWIRTSGQFDGVIDFDSVTRDPAQPDRFLPAFDSGDHLHPGDGGYREMGDAIDLALFRRTGTGPTAQNPSPMTELARPHERLVQKQLDGTTRSVIGPGGKPMDLFIPSTARARDTVDLVVHFLAAAWLPEQAVADLGTNTIAAVVNLGAGSGIYDRTFSDPAAFDSLLAVVTREASAATGHDVRIGRVTLVGFSAGHGAVRAILRDSSHFARVSAILLLDGMHTSYIPEGTVLAAGGAIDTTNLVAFAKFARAAVRGEKSFVVTHSEIFPGTFASTTETADWLLHSLGLHSTPVLQPGPRGMQQISDVTAGRFEILGFAGNSAPDHIDQLHSMPEMLARLLSR
jgi:lysophospholipase L1-like esterase